ncbi:L,D-transpeptidase [Bradyrhizobium sp. NP1]|uniref:L,D-transpeptidase n=1 Tax=Bradyrhizobium sp. NP1 TaxID=3049772 RepID=UPI0025A638A7|nr:L,D-transpeptidase [Bradyrhizobium sp. NP1]WJR75259.1 L,D-transpeptidase [Bradyrhizobium sp. NP1]
MRVTERRISNRAISTNHFWGLALLAAAGTVAAGSEANAAVYYWQDSDPSFYRPVPMAQPRSQRPRRQSARKNMVEKETSAKPQGPLIIAVSIDKQRVRVFDANGFFAEAPVSTGMRGHSTPTGVFSVIQKHKFHHSNIYSGAPMPYMQRITWSGVALHAGVLPGYPASHGCIRMPMSFAVKMWNWTRMGARVFVTPYEIPTPTSFAHPLLATMKVAPQPVATEEPASDKPVPAKADKGAAEAKPDNSESRLELRSTVGHVDPPKASAEAAENSSSHEQTHTADAGRNIDAAAPAVTMSDAAGGTARREEEQADGTRSRLVKPADSDAAPGVAIATQDKPAQDKPAQDKRAQYKPAETVAVDMKPVDGPKPADKLAQARLESSKADDRAEARKSEPAVAEAAKPAAAQSAASPSATRPEEAKTVAVAPDAKKDQSRMAGETLPARESRRPGQIAVLISRKDSKLYVRENFKPWFEVPVTIAPSDRPLGTHVFTAEVDKNNANGLHWSVVSLPMSARSVQRSQDQEQIVHRRKAAATGPVEMKSMPAPDSPAEALDRISVPADAMARVNEALATGGSIIVTDQGINQGETGEGTDFIVSLR